MEVLTTPSTTMTNPPTFKDHEHLKWQTTVRAYNTQNTIIVIIVIFIVLGVNTP